MKEKTMTSKYDYLIVGCGLFGSVFARQATDAGKTCLMIDKRSHIGGNCYTEDNHGIHVHKYGPHIFHTNNDRVWEFMNQWASFNNYVNRPKLTSGERSTLFRSIYLLCTSYGASIRPKKQSGRWRMCKFRAQTQKI